VSGGLHGTSFGYVVLLCFWTVFVAELVGDKSIYSIASLSLRFRAGVVFTGITVAFAFKMLAAVLLVRLLIRLHFWTDFLSAVAFFFSAFFLWIREPDSIQEPNSANSSWWRGVMACFLTLFLTEWGDPSQIALAALSTKFHSLLGPWLGGTLGMAAKGVLAMALGVKLRDRLPLNSLRVIASASFLVLGILALRGLVYR
jgi:putative Ca2+/H+ antiporter (TMEM165/GDT1 family)